jgi:hypothetical protein
MKYRLTLGLLAMLTLAAACTPARAVDQEAIDRAIEKGVKALRKMQQSDGTWPHQYIGATALAGLTLLECSAKEDDKDVLRAADAVRKASIDLTHTYSIALSLLFLDRLGDREDEPLIKSLAERLLAGQNAGGAWSYSCPSISEEEKQRLREKLKKRKVAEASPPRGVSAPEFPPPQLGFPGGMPWGAGPGDNSNTQFAALGLWVAGRHGVPIEQAANRLADHFRSTQMEDGGWAYITMPRPPGAPMFPGMGSTPAMTCAGLIALAIADGAVLERARERKPDAKLPDISQDKELEKGLQALGAVIDNPKGVKPEEAPSAPPAPPFMPPARVGGRTYYFLWSLERVAVALDLKTLGKKDWYGWGAEILLENQLPDGTWSGDYAEGGVDTCFALLFLRRANLVRDLTTRIKGKVADPGERELRVGLGSNPLQIQKRMQSGIETTGAKPIEKRMLKATSKESLRLAEALLKATGRQRERLLEIMENEKGVKYTEALAAAIPKLEGEDHRKAREALANRLTRMKDETLAEYCQDDDPEIRRAAALAAGQKDSKALVPNLIALLRDPEISVVQAAHASLKSLTEQDFGPAAKATREERDQAALQWLAWWNKKYKK